MNVEERRWLRPKEVAERFGISHKHVYELLAKGLLPATKRKGFGWIVDGRKMEAELEAAIEVRQT